MVCINLICKFADIRYDIYMVAVVILQSIKWWCDLTFALLNKSMKKSGREQIS